MWPTANPNYVVQHFWVLSDNQSMQAPLDISRLFLIAAMCSRIFRRWQTQIVLLLSTEKKYAVAINSMLRQKQCWSKINFFLSLSLSLSPKVEIRALRCGIFFKSIFSSPRDPTERPNQRPARGKLAEASIFDLQERFFFSLSKRER